MDFDQTIVAISTAPGAGAIAVVRLSGERCLAILKSIFKSQKRGEPEFKSHQAKHGFIYDKELDEIIDEVVVTTFMAPNSYTGEDVAEISCHGNPLLTRRILSACLNEGARLAQPGEFTRRAFLSGKMDLTQAEAVLDLIQAKTNRGSQAALSALKGDLGKQINKARDDIKNLLASMVAAIDFPDEVDQLADEEIEQSVDDVLLGLNQLLATANAGKYLREGLKLAIVGRPNAGKSSLLNRLLRVERAIVTDIPGTTRDSLEELAEINGIPVTLVDTAGVRNTEDRLEQLGIERTKHVLGESQLVLLVADIVRGWGKEEEEIIASLEDKPWVLLWNKMDLADESQKILSQKEYGGLYSLFISAKNGSGIDSLAKWIENWACTDLKLEDGGASLNMRQASLCEKAISALQLVKHTLQNRMPHDCLATDLKAALEYLSEIGGFAVSEEVIGSVFANFCIGK